MLYGLVLESPLLSLLAFFQGIIPVVQPTRRDLAPASLALGEGVWVFLKDPDDIPPVLAVEARTQSIPHLRGPRENRKGESARIC